MITDTFDISTEPIITPEMVYGERGDLCKTCIVTFSDMILKNAIEKHGFKQIAKISVCNGGIPIYGAEINGRMIALYLSPIGSGGAGNFVIESSWITGADNYVMFGSAGCLDSEAVSGKLVLPTFAYRDEGMSYHYAAAGDYIRIKGSEFVKGIFDRMHIPYVEGRVWTTDAMYRETRLNMQRRRAEGCIAVEMELAGVQAVCDFHKLNLYNFLMVGDVLDLPEWDSGELQNANHSLDNLELALKIACECDRSENCGQG